MRRKKIRPTCPVCGFKAKNKSGLHLHMMNKESCRRALGYDFQKKEPYKKEQKEVREKTVPSHADEAYEAVDEIDILRNILKDEQIIRGRENIINSLKRGDIYDLYDLNEIMRERDIRPYKRRVVIRAWSDAMDMDVPEDLRKDLKMRGRRSYDRGVEEPSDFSKRMSRVRERKLDRLEDLALKREIREEEEELKKLGRKREKEKAEMVTFLPLKRKNGSVTYQPVKVSSPLPSSMSYPFPQPARDERLGKLSTETGKRLDKLESMFTKMQEDREHRVIRDDVKRLGNKLDNIAEKRGGGMDDALRNEIKDLRSKLDDERLGSLKDAIAGKLQDLDKRTQHGELDMYSKVSEKLENIGAGKSKKTPDEHRMEMERIDHKKRFDFIERQYRGIQKRIDDVADVIKPAVRVLAMEHARDLKKGAELRKKRVKHSENDLRRIEKRLREEDSKEPKKKEKIIKKRK